MPAISKRAPNNNRYMECNLKEFQNIKFFNVARVALTHRKVISLVFNRLIQHNRANQKKKKITATIKKNNNNKKSEILAKAIVETSLSNMSIKSFGRRFQKTFI